MKIDDDFIHAPMTRQQGAAMDAVYSKAKGTYRIPNTLGAFRELHILGFDVKEQGISKSYERRQFLMKKNIQASGVDERLRPYQREDVNFLIQKDSLASFSEMRTGKTPTLCQVLQKRNVKSIVVCPASLTLQWVDEIHNWTKMSAATVGKATPKKRAELYKTFVNGEFNVLVVSKDTVKNDLDALMNIGAELMLIDEAHFLRNYKTKQSEAMFRLGAKVKYRYALTGTPAPNANHDVYGIFKFLQPTKYPSYWQFVERYFVVADSPFGKKVGDFKTERRRREFWEIIEEISVQRKRKDVMKWLPKKQYQTVRLEMDKKQQKAYKQMLEMFEIEDTDISAPSVLAQLTRLRQITVAPSMLGLDAPSAKEDYILEWLQDNPNEQVIIFSNFSSYLKKLYVKLEKSEKEGIIGLIVGDTPQDLRQYIVKDFQSGRRRIILANIQTVGVGLTLDRAGTVIFLDRDYVPAMNDQAEDRAVATTEASEVQNTLIIDLVCKGSVDEKIIKAVKKKQNITKIVNDYKSMKEFMKE